MLICHLMQTSRNGQQGLTRSGFTHKGDQLNRRIQQQIQRKALLAISRFDPPKACTLEPRQRFKFT